MEKKSVRLYNVMFPAFMFFLFPTYLWLLILPFNFLFDSLVLFFWMKRRGIAEKKTLWKQTIGKLWCLGFLADLVGAGLTFGLLLLIEELPLGWDIVHFPGATLLALPGVALAGGLIYWFNRLLSFRNTDLTKEEIHGACMYLALLTAPYTMLIPLYG